MTSTLFAMDTSFFSSLGAYGFDARCEMLRELGYDATYLTLWNEAAWQDVPRLTTFPAFHWHTVEGRTCPGSWRRRRRIWRWPTPSVAGATTMAATTRPRLSGWTTASWASSPCWAPSAAGCDGPIGIKGYSVGEDACTKLRRSLTAYRDIERRLDAHLEWASLRPPPSQTHPLNRPQSRSDQRLKAEPVHVCPVKRSPGGPGCCAYAIVGSVLI